MLEQKTAVIIPFHILSPKLQEAEIQFLYVLPCSMHPYKCKLQQWRIQGDGGIHPPTGLKHGGLERSFCENSNFFRRFASIIVQLIKK
jgi:hypothetical protein